MGSKGKSAGGDAADTAVDCESNDWGCWKLGVKKGWERTGGKFAPTRKGGGGGDHPEDRVDQVFLVEPEYCPGRPMRT